MSGTVQAGKWSRLAAAGLALLGLAVAAATGALAAAPVPGAGASGEGQEAQVSLAFQDADVREIFASLADAAGWNFVALPDLTGKATLAIKGLSVEQAVDMVARATGFAYVLSANTLVVGARSSLEARFDPEGVRPDRPAAPKPAPPAEETATEFVRLNYVRAAAMKQLATMVLPEGAIRVDEASNLLVVQGTAQQLDALRRLVAEYDRPPAQVLIEARVEEVLGNATEDLGLAWQLPRVGVSLAPRFGSVRLDPEELLATLHALEEQGRSRLLARPQVTTINGQAATIFIGDEIPIILKGQGDAPDTLQTITAGVRLEITPFVGSDGTITADVKPEVSTIAGYRVAGDQQLPQIRTRKAQTRIRVKDGEPIVIGGLINQQESETVSGLPVLKEFPVLGGFFSTTRTDQQQSEMLIFLIPRVLPGEGATAKAEQGQAGSNGAAAPGSREQGSTAGERTRWQMPSFERPQQWAIRLDAAGAQESAWEIGVERPVGTAQTATTSLVLTPVSAGSERASAWGLGLSWRWYYPSSLGGAWLGLGGEVIWPNAGVGSVAAGTGLTVVSIEAGARTPIERVPLFLEPFVRWVPAVWGDAALVELPRRTPGLWLGLDVGWAF
ncbi:secretin N-terminal domain-containing protein [Carboxydochorda subterranea]|uniref:Secretin N-terminal domain-containing protein n=1 Tax=Carboxydichorda subterranea TaxID=3109565 RepID=A0ABZ1BW42_9FIRM|nr:secretin N-terminal domain-containing protein [Limnochorda sp. L945t]WRP16357.1 secretin N-terminal domain-containing protein [Limnochorda sp. L945t]